MWKICSDHAICRNNISFRYINFKNFFCNLICIMVAAQNFFPVYRKKIFAFFFYVPSCLRAYNETYPQRITSKIVGRRYDPMIFFFFRWGRWYVHTHIYYIQTHTTLSFQTSTKITNTLRILPLFLSYNIYYVCIYTRATSSLHPLFCFFLFFIILAIFFILCTSATF